MSRTWLVHVVGAAIVLGAGGAIYHGVYAGMERDIVSLKERIERTRELAANSAQAEAANRQLRERLGELRQAVDRTRRRLPARVGPASFVEQATRLAEDHGLEVKSTQTGVPQHYESHSTVDVSYSLSGSYASIVRCLAGIDQLSQLSRVTSLKWDRAGDPASYPVHVTFQLYYRTDPNDKDEQRRAL